METKESSYARCQTMHPEKETGSGADDQVIQIAGYQNSRKAYIEKLLIERMSEIYGEELMRSCMKNPYSRLLIKFDGLSNKEQASMYEYAEKVVAEHKGRRLDRRNLYSVIIGFGDFETWEMMEEYADKLLLSEKGLSAKNMKRMACRYETV